MSSVPASTESSQLFDEETGEVQPVAVAEQVCSYVDGQSTTPSSSSSEPKKMDSTHRSGNKIGHDPNNLKLKTNYPIKKGKGGMPALLHDVSERLDKWAVEPNLYPNFTRALSVNGMHIRSEAREAIAVTLKAMLRKLNLATMVVAKPSTTGLRCWSVKKLLEDAPIGRKRLERVLHRFYRITLVESHRQCKKNEDGTYKHFASIRVISERLFELLGVTPERIKKQRDKASDRIKQKAAELRMKAAQLVKTGKRAVDQATPFGANDSDPQPNKIDRTRWNECWKKAVEMVKKQVPRFHPERHKPAIRQQCIALYEAGA